MTVWQEAIFSLCLCAVITGLVRLLLPAGSWQRIGQTVTSFLLVAIALHIVGSFLGQTLPTSIPKTALPSATVVSEKGLDWLERATVEQVHSIVLQLAQQSGVVASDVHIQTKREPNAVEVERVALTVTGNEADVSAFHKALSQAIDGEVIIERKEQI